MMRRLLISLLVLACLPAAAGGAEWRLALDPEATRITFTLGATLHTVEGTARLARGEIRFDPEAGTAAGRVVVDARSAETGNAGRDEDMHGKVLESERYPEIVLVPESWSGDFRPAGASELTVRGTLEIHGGRHPVQLPARVEVAGERIEVRLTFAVPYVAWGMKDPSKLVLRVAKEVEVTVEAAGTLTRP